MFSVNGRSFHSKYSPEKEAQRQFDLFLSMNPGGNLVFFFNPGENHLAKVASIRGFRSISLYTKGWGFPDRVFIGRWDREFSDIGSLIQWIDPLLPLLLLLSPRFFFHPSFLSIDPEEGNIFQTTFSKILATKKRELMTSGFFSAAYKRNILKNLGRRGSTSTTSLSGLFSSGRVPCIVASGPGLAKYKNFLPKERHKLFIICLPSSISFLHGLNIEPDCIVTTDPGYWAGLSLDFLPPTWNCPILASTTSCLGSAKNFGKERTQFFSQNTAIEEVALGGADFRDMEIVPERGTVAATAMEIVLSFTPNYCLFVGFDLKATQQSSHVHPHPFDPFFLQGTSRLLPFETRLYERGVRSREALEHYRNWFHFNRGLWDGRVFSLEPVDQNKKKHDSILPVVSGIPKGKPNFVSAKTEKHKRFSLIDYQEEAKKFEKDPLEWILTSKSKDSPRIDEFLIQNNFFELKTYLSNSTNVGSWRPGQAFLDFSKSFSPESSK
jgi:hypothetical protein